MRISMACLLAMWGTGLATAAEGEDPPEPWPMVTVEVAIVEFSDGGPAAGAEQGDAEVASETLIGRIRELEQEGKLDSVTRVRLTSLEEQTAMVQLGEQVAQPSGRAAFGGFGRDRPDERGFQTVFSRENVGLMVSTTTRIADDGRILVELSVQRSRLRPQRDRSAEAEPGGPAPRPTETLTLRSTLRVANGETVVAQSTEARAGNAKTQQVILVTARADDGDEKAARAEQQRPHVLRVFVLKHVAAASAVSTLKEVYRDRKELRFDAEPRSQRVMVSGPRELLEEIEALLRQLDEAPQEKAAPKKDR